jgi:hypothetical protein
MGENILRTLFQAHREPQHMEKEENIDRIRNQASSRYLVHSDSPAALSTNDHRLYQVCFPPDPINLKDFL